MSPAKFAGWISIRYDQLYRHHQQRMKLGRKQNRGKSQQSNIIRSKKTVLQKGAISKGSIKGETGLYIYRFSNFYK